MFGSLAKNSTLYILDKNNKPVLKVGKIVDAKINPQFYGLSSQEIDFTVESGGDNYEFKKIPASLSIVSPSVGIVISDNIADMTKECENMFANSQQILDSIDYHNSVVESKDEIMSVLNPRYAKEKEQEDKLNALEGRIGNVEKGIGNIESMLAKVLNQNLGGK